MVNNITAVKSIKRRNIIVGYTLRDENTGQVTDATYDSVKRVLYTGGIINGLTLTADNKIRFEGTNGTKSKKMTDYISNQVEQIFIDLRLKYVTLWTADKTRTYTVEKGYNYVKTVKDRPCTVFKNGTSKLLRTREQVIDSEYFGYQMKSKAGRVDGSYYGKLIVLGRSDESDIKYMVAVTGPAGVGNNAVKNLFDTIAILDIYRERIVGNAIWESGSRVCIESFTDTWAYECENLRIMYEEYIKNNYKKEMAMLMIQDKKDPSVPDLYGNIQGIKVVDGNCALPPMVNLKCGEELYVNGRKTGTTTYIKLLQFNGITGINLTAIKDIDIDAMEIRNIAGFKDFIKLMITNRYCSIDLDISKLKLEDRIQLVGELIDAYVSVRSSMSRRVLGYIKIKKGQFTEDELNVLSLYLKHKIEVFEEDMKNKYYNSHEIYMDYMDTVMSRDDYRYCAPRVR